MTDDPLTPGDHGDYTVTYHEPKVTPIDIKTRRPKPVSPDAPAQLFTPTPYVYRDPASIPRRECLYAEHYFRKFVSATIAPGGVGKSSLTLGEVISMILRKDWLGEPPENPVKCWYINGEEPEEEMWRRVAAFCQNHGIDGLLFIDTMTFKLASYGPNNNVVLNEAAYAALENGIRANGIVTRSPNFVASVAAPRLVA
jgi:hypothetical protein